MNLHFKPTMGRALQIGLSGLGGFILGAVISPFYGLYMAFYEHIEGEGTYLFPSANNERPVWTSNSYWQQFKEALGFMHPEEKADVYDYSLSSSLKELLKGLLKSIPRFIESVLVSPWVFATKMAVKLIKSFQWDDEMDNSIAAIHGTRKFQNNLTSTPLRLHQQFPVNNTQANEIKLAEVLKQIPDYKNHTIIKRNLEMDAVLDDVSLICGDRGDERSNVIAVEFNHWLDAFDYYYRNAATPLFVLLHDFPGKDNIVYHLPSKGKSFHDLADAINHNNQLDIQIKTLVNELEIEAGRQRKTIRDGDERWLVLEFNTMQAASDYHEDLHKRHPQLDIALERYLNHSMHCEAHYNAARKATNKENVWTISILVENITLDELLNLLLTDIANKQLRNRLHNSQITTQTTDARPKVG